MEQTILPTILQITKNTKNRAPKPSHSKSPTKNGTIPLNVQRPRHKTCRTNMAKNKRHRPKQRSSNFNKRKTLQWQNTQTNKTHPRHAQSPHPKIRTNTKKQNISYEVNLKKFEFLKETAQHKKLLLTLDKSKKIFQSFPPREQLANLVDIMALYVLHGIKNDVYSVLEPEKRGENQLGFWKRSKNQMKKLVIC